MLDTIDDGPRLALYEPNREDYMDSMVLLLLRYKFGCHGDGHDTHERIASGSPICALNFVREKLYIDFYCERWQMSFS